MQDRPKDVPSRPETQPNPQPEPPGSPQEPPAAPRPGAAPGPSAGPAPDPSAGPVADPQTGLQAVPQAGSGYGPPPAHPPAPQFAYGYGYGQPSGPPSPPGRKGGAGRAVLWAAVGALLASALWAGGILLLAPFDEEPDLAGYRARANLCSSVDYTALRTEYAEEDDAPTHNALKHKVIDQSYCSISLKRTSSSSYSDAYLSVQMELHKKTDPSAEFTALWSEYDQRYEDYDVEKVSGYGDEAYLVTEDTTSGSGTSGSRAVILAVRDGWMTYQMSWSVYTSSYETTTPPAVGEVSRWVKRDTRSTLDNLRSE